MTQPESLAPRQAAKRAADIKRFAMAAAYWRGQIARHGKSSYAQKSEQYWRKKLMEHLHSVAPTQDARSAAEVIIKLAELVAEQQNPTHAAVAP